MKIWGQPAMVGPIFHVNNDKGEIMEDIQHVVDGFTWQYVSEDVDNNKIYTIVGIPESYPFPDEVWELAFADITEIDGLYQASIGLAGRMGDEEFTESFSDFELAARYCISTLEEHFFSEDGKFHGVDAIR